MLKQSVEICILQGTMASSNWSMLLTAFTGLPAIFMAFKLVSGTDVRPLCIILI